MKNNNFIIGIDQYGDTYRDLGKYPRKELLERLYSKHASKMYMDKKDGSTKHIGYVIAGKWITLYSLISFEK